MDDSLENCGSVVSKDIPNRIITIPNILTAARILMLPFLIWALDARADIGNNPAIIIGGTMILTDLLDGWLARLLNQHSRLGWVLDPISDKMIVDILAIFFAIKGLLPYWVMVVVIVRDLAILSFSLPMVRKGMLPKPVIWGRLSPFLWGISYALIIAGLGGIAWVTILLALILSIFSAGIYYGGYRKAMGSEH